MREEDNLPRGKDIVNPNCPDATWDISGLFTFDNNIMYIIKMGRILSDYDLPIESVHGCYPLMWNNGRGLKYETKDYKSIAT